VKSISACIACLVLLLLVVPAKADAGAPDSGPSPCKSDDDCAPPTAYCNTTLGRCVQCKADLNCFGVGLVCNVEKGVCANCRSNADCFGEAPYCSQKYDLCVECVSDGNCGNQGIKCVDGACGTCGDGICSPKERSGAVGLCKDCFEGCPKTDLKSKVGEKVASGTLGTTPSTFFTNCGQGLGESASFKWTAPESGAYAFDGGDSANVSLLSDDCAGEPLACWGGPASAYLNKGQTVAILVDRFDMAGGPYSLGIRAVAQVCDPSFCPPTPFGVCCNVDGTCGSPSPAGCTHYDGGLPPSATCLSNAKMRGDPLCMQGTYCSCSACPSQQDGCGFEKGCLDILSCMAKFDCVDLDCYAPERCASIIDTYGGPKSLAYFDATSLAACDRASGCTLNCDNQPPLGTGGAGGSVSNTGGRATGGRSGSSGFSGGGGSGGRSTELPDAGGDVDLPKGKSTTSGGCGCTVPRERNSGLAGLAAMACLGLAAARRKRR
jgi:hypothetical protein